VPPDSVRCTREEQLQTLHLRVSQTHLRYNSPDCPVCHMSVRCTREERLQTLHLRVSQAHLRYNSPDCLHATVDSAKQTVQIRCQSSGQRGTELFGVAPDCPVPHEDKASNGRPTPSPNGRMTWRHTGHCPVRPSPAAFSNGYNLDGGYKYHPNQPLQRGGTQATF
jgi:hypothetical protein